ncbi:MAG: hypothetical protein ACTSPB_00675 [Candidatus Thorarchaeota archaeon]
MDAKKLLSDVLTVVVAVMILHLLVTEFSVLIAVGFVLFFVMVYLIPFILLKVIKWTREKAWIKFALLFVPCVGLMYGYIYSLSEAEVKLLLIPVLLFFTYQMATDFASKNQTKLSLYMEVLENDGKILGRGES